MPSITPTVLGRALRTAPLAVLILMGCATSPPAPTAPTSAAALTPGASMASIMEGDVRFPKELASGGQVIPTGIGSNKNYRTLQANGANSADTDLPVPGATVTALDPATRQPAPVAPATTDAQGRYRLDGLTPGELYLIQVVFQAADGSRSFRLLALGRPGEAAPVSWRSTAVVASLLQAPDTQDPRRIDLAGARAAEAQRQAEWEALAPEARLTFLGGLLTLPTAPAGASGTPATTSAPLPLPIVSALPALPLLSSSPAPSSRPVVGQVGQEVASTQPVLGASPLPSVLPSVVDALLPIDTASVVPTLPVLGGGQASPTVAATFTPTPTPSGLVSTGTGVLKDTTSTAAPQPSATPKPLLPGLF